MIAAVDSLSGDSSMGDRAIENGYGTMPRGGKLRVLVDARKLHDGGIGTYTQNLISGLIKTGEAEISIIVKPGENLPSAWLSEIKVLEDRAKLYSFDEMWNLAKRIDFSEIDLFHVPHYTLPFKVPVPAVITVHDLIHINHPEKKYYPWIATPLIKSAMKRAKTILTVSNASKREIDKLFKESGKIASKIRVVPNAIDQYYIESAETEGQPTNARLKIGGKYFMTLLSNIKPHKGLKDLLTAYQIAKKKFSRDVKLALVGQGTESIVSNPEILNLTTDIRGVTVLGVVSKAELADLYLNAEALVVPSLAEGFYLPAIEAQAMGTTVITRPVPSILELTTRNDIVTPDFSVESLANKMIEFVDSKKERETGAIKEHLQRFDQLSLAKIVIQIYRETLGRDNKGGGKKSEGKAG